MWLRMTFVYGSEAGTSGGEAWVLGTGGPAVPRKPPGFSCGRSSGGSSADGAPSLHCTGYPRGLSQNSKTQDLLKTQNSQALKNSRLWVLEVFLISFFDHFLSSIFSRLSTFSETPIAVGY